MSSFRSVAAMVKSLCAVSVMAFAVALLIAPDASAQQPATGRRRVPRMTSDDVLLPKSETTTDETSSETASAAPEPGKKDSSAKSSGEEAKANPDEAAWRENVSKARDRAKTLERQAEDAELRVTALRNEMGMSGQGANHRNQVAADLDQAGELVKELRRQSRAASDDLEKLLEYGRRKGFTESEGPKAASDDGKPNAEYYRSRYSALTEELQTADRHIVLYENRVRDANQRITSNSVSGDNYYIAQLKQDRDEAQEKLDQARAERTKKQGEIETLMEEARRAGVPPGVFR